jgi:recombination protein RecT
VAGQGPGVAPDVSEARRPAIVIPEERLPPGFAAAVERPAAEPVPALPAATVVLVREAAAGIEVFLLRRNRSSGFVPGAYVFPGGRVDPADAHESLADRALGLPAAPPAPFWMAAVRETFEETGVLLTHAAPAAPVGSWREALLEDRTTLAALFDVLGGGPDFRRTVHFAHWVTPLVEPRRFDTHFFLTTVPSGVEATADPREMSDAVWISPAHALERFRHGSLPMVFPTVRTLESLDDFKHPDQVLDAFRDRPVLTVMPRLVRTPGGVGIVVDEEI